MVSIYVNNYGWILGRDNQGNLHYTRFRDGAKTWPNEYAGEFISYARQAEQQGHHIDKVWSHDISDGRR